MPTLTLENLSAILRECAEADSTFKLTEGDLDSSFDSLGCDSLAVLNTVVRIERDLRVVLPEAVMSQARTPRALIQTVNEIAAGTPPDEGSGAAERVRG